MCYWVFYRQFLKSFLIEKRKKENNNEKHKRSRVKEFVKFKKDIE